MQTIFMGPSVWAGGGGWVGGGVGLGPTAMGRAVDLEISTAIARGGVGVLAGLPWKTNERTMMNRMAVTTKATASSKTGRFCPETAGRFRLLEELGK